MGRGRLEKKQRQVRDDAILIQELRKQCDELKKSNAELVERKRHLGQERGKWMELMEAGRLVQEEKVELRHQIEITNDRLTKEAKTYDVRKQAMFASMEKKRNLEKMIKTGISEKDALSAQIRNMSTEKMRLYNEIRNSETNFNKTVLRFEGEKMELGNTLTHLYQEIQRLEHEVQVRNDVLA